MYYRTMRETIYPRKHYPEYKVPPTPDTDEDDSPKLESSEKRGRAEKAQLKRKRSSTHSASAVNKAKIRRRNSPTKDTTTDGELARIQDERRSTLRLTAKCTRLCSSCRGGFKNCGSRSSFKQGLVESKPLQARSVFFKARVRRIIYSLKQGFVSPLKRGLTVAHVPA